MPQNAREIWPDAIPVSEMEIYKFDLNGFIIVKGALSPEEVAACNQTIDDYQDMKTGEWRGWVHGHDYGGNEGLNLQQVYESGPAFEKFIDHPSWVAKVQHFVNGGNFDHHHGPMYIDENFASIRRYGQSIGLHSGGQDTCIRTQFKEKNGNFYCCQVNVLVALNDIGPGDGATMCIPSSHKANFMHPQVEAYRMSQGESKSMDGIEGAIEVHLDAGDALIFVDSLMHGSAARINEGQRRISVFRYGASWSRSRHGYRPSPELLERLNPQARLVVEPRHQDLLPPHVEQHDYSAREKHIN